MRKIFTLLIALFCISAFAEPVSESEARKTALSLLKSELGGSRLKSGNKLTSENLTLVKVKKYGNTPLYYVYNAENDGFVIVSGVEEAPAILAYGLEGGIDMNNMPDGAKALLKSYAAAMKKAAADPYVYKAMTDSEKKENIEPMIKAMWDQEAPYWNRTKFKSFDTGESVQCLTGCPATATAAMMKYYHKKNGWFSGTDTIPGYDWNVTDSYGTLDVDTLLPVTFDWEHCDNTYGKNGNDSISDFAVATVMRYCGQAVFIHYDVYSSGNNSNSQVFGINKYLVGDDNFQAVLFERNSCTDKEWQELIYHELSNGRPVNLTGSGPDGGHSFICDGYKYNDGDLYHINWGWSGINNAYFRYDSLVANATYNFSFENKLITYVTDEEKAEIEKMGFTTPDFYQSTSNQISFYADTAAENSYIWPLQYEFAGDTYNNRAYFKTLIYPMQEDFTFTPCVEVTNTKNNASIILKAPDPDEIDPYIDVFSVDLNDLKSEMIKNDLGTTDIYKLLLKASDDPDKNDYCKPKYYWYYFRFNESADSIEFLSPIKIDDLVEGDGGETSSAFHFTVNPEFQGQELFLGLQVYIEAIDQYNDLDTAVVFMEGQINETDIDGYLNTYAKSVEDIKSRVEGKKFHVCLYNGMKLRSNSDLTAIEEIASESNVQQKSGKRYNLAGQEVDDNYKGIVILNGAKHVQN